MRNSILLPFFMVSMSIFSSVKLFLNRLTRDQEISDLSPVGQAIEKGKYKKALALLRAGSFVSLIEKDGTSNLRKATSFRLNAQMNVKLIKALLSLSDRKIINYCEAFFSPALNQAAYAGSVEVIHLLMNSGAEVNVRGQYQLTPLMHGVIGYLHSNKEKAIQRLFERQLAAVKALVFHGANVHDVHDEGLTALEIYVENEVKRNTGHVNQDLISHLVEHWADPPDVFVSARLGGQASVQILKKVYAAVRNGLVRRDFRINEITGALKKPMPPELISLVFEFKP